MRTAKPIREVLGEAEVPLVVARLLGGLLVLLLGVRAAWGQSVDPKMVFQSYRVGQRTRTDRTLERTHFVRLLMICKAGCVLVNASTLFTLKTTTFFLLIMCFHML